MYKCLKAHQRESFTSQVFELSVYHLAKQCLNKAYIKDHDFTMRGSASEYERLLSLITEKYFGHSLNPRFRHN